MNYIEYMLQKEAGLNPITKAIQLAGKGIGKLFKPTGEGLLSLLIGSKGGPDAINRLSRLRHFGPGKELSSWSQIPHKRFAELSLDPKMKPLLKYLNVGSHSIPVKRKLTLGGLAGFAHKHPIITGVGALGAHTLYKNRDRYRQYAPAAQEVDQYYSPVSPMRGTF